MLYDTTSLRRQDRAFTEEAACHLLQHSEHGVLCLQDSDGGGYGIPLNYVWDGATHIYMHCAPEGHKLECIRLAPRATFVVTGPARILPALFSTAYESVLVHGTIGEVTDEEEKRHALMLLIRKLTPQEASRGKQYIARGIQATTVLRFSIRQICGKAHRSQTGSPA